LREASGERWEALQKIMAICEDEEVDVLVISGDLFDENPDAEGLRGPIQDIFTGNGFDIVLIPGNHDKEVCADMYFGKNGKALSYPDNVALYEDVRFVGLPYRDATKEEMLDTIRGLRDILSDGKTNIIIFHGELLDSSYHRENYGNEGEKRYMPVKLSYFKGLPVDYVLAGHFHSNFNVFKIDDGGFFVYPGSPVPITRGETGKRKVNMFEVGDDPTPQVLDGPFYQKVNIKLNPIDNEDPLGEIQEKVKELEPNARALFSVAAYIDSTQLGLSEREFAEKVRELLSVKSADVDPNLNVWDISGVLQNDLFKEFMEELEQTGFSKEMKQRLRDVAIRAVMEAEL
jgi:DNA repair exonuclease SbcCD nuclease subunit